MRSVAHEGLAVFEIDGGFQMELLGKGIGPEFALDVETEMVAVHIRVNREAARRDARLEGADRLGQIVLQSVHIEGGLATKLADAKVDDRAEGLRIIP